MKTIFISLASVMAFFLCISTGMCQTNTILNGSFDGTENNWNNCGLTGPEATYTESGYGGTNTTNYVAEVDNGDAKGLCQNVTLSSGAHTLSFNLGRRTDCLSGRGGAPGTVTVQVCLIDPGNAANKICQTFSRNNTTFGLSAASWAFNTSSFPSGFPAGGTVTLQITNVSDYSATCTSPCGSGCNDNYGMIMDNLTFGTLPVTLVNFQAAKNDSEVNINWQTEMEINNDYFLIEKSKNAVDFTTVGTVDGAGNSQSTLNYQTTDKAPYNGISYYRLKQVDYDGKFSYSKIVAVENDGPEINIYPNPSQGSFKIDVLSEKQPYQIEIIDAEGRTVYKGTKEPGSSSEINGLPKGVYVVRIVGQDVVVSRKLVILL